MVAFDGGHGDIGGVVVVVVVGGMRMHMSWEIT